MKKIVVIGGGTGTFVVLSGLKKYDLDISAVVSMMDSGGSTGRLRDQLGVLPPGDLRQCLVALSEASQLWRTLFLYRFDNGDLKGHNFGNIFITALEKNTSNYQEVVDTAAFILQSKGKVIPVTFDKSELNVEYEDGEVIVREGVIDEVKDKESRIKKTWLTPSPQPNKKALQAILDADYILMGPGDLYTSIVPNLIVPEVKEAIIQSKAKIIYIMNLMTKSGQTTHYTAADHITDLEKYGGRMIDIILMNNSDISEQIIESYTKSGEVVVQDNLQDRKDVFRMDLLSETVYNKSETDTAMRSLLRHDSQKIAAEVMNIIEKNYA